MNENKLEDSKGFAALLRLVRPLKGKGVPSLRNKNIRGDHYVTLVVQVPTKLNEEAKEALRKFDEACGNRPATEPKDGSEKSEKKKKSFMDKIKETFED